MKKIIYFIVVSSLVFLTTAFYFANLSVADSRVIKVWEQPESVDSGKYKYRLSILEIEPKLQFFKVGRKQNQYKIVISKNHTKQQVLFMFGHIKQYSFGEINNFSSKFKELNIMKYVKKCKVEWSNKGVLFIEPSGHELFFPLKVYPNE